METTNTEPGRNKGGLDGKAGPGRTPGVAQVKRSRGHLDMEYVYKTERGGEDHPEDSPGQASCRALLREDRAGFLRMLNAMRKEHQARKDKILGGEASKVAAGAQDEGSKGVIELIDQLLGEWEESRG